MNNIKAQYYYWRSAFLLLPLAVTFFLEFFVCDNKQMKLEAFFSFHPEPKRTKTL